MTVKIKSFSVGNGDMFYIDHASDNFTIIDCNLPANNDEHKNIILDEISRLSKASGITRFISTHADEDHIHGLKDIDDRIKILNFYTTKNETTKVDESESFKHYVTLRDDTNKAFYLSKGAKRKWMNKNDDDRGSAGLSVHWPILDNDYYVDEQANAKKGQTPNNLSPIIIYSLEDGAKVCWMGDLETAFMDNIVVEIELPEVDILFAPHHGRTSGVVPDLWLDQLNPKVIIIGEGPLEHLADYDGWNVIKQNEAGNINFYLETGLIDIFVERSSYSVNFLKNNYLDNDEENEYYLGSIELKLK